MSTSLSNRIVDSSKLNNELQHLSPDKKLLKGNLSPISSIPQPYVLCIQLGDKIEHIRFAADSSIRAIERAIQTAFELDVNTTTICLRNSRNDVVVLDHTVLPTQEILFLSVIKKSKKRLSPDSPPSSDDDYLSGDEDDKKRKRRKACEIERRFKCSFPNCGKFYGSENAQRMHLKLKHPELAQQVQTSKKESQKHSNHSHHPHHANHLNHSLSSSSSPGTSNYLSYFPIQNTNVSSNASSSSKPCTGRLFEILQQSNHIDDSSSSWTAKRRLPIPNTSAVNGNSTRHFVQNNSKKETNSKYESQLPGILLTMALTAEQLSSKNQESHFTPSRDQS